MMKKTLYLTFIVLLLVVTNIESKRSMSRSRSSGSGRSSGRKTNTNSQPAPTPLSHSQASAPKPSLFGWQEKPAQKSRNEGHSYPQSNTGLSGNKQPKTPQQENIQRSNVPLQQSVKPAQTSQSGHSYPQSNTGLSGNSPPKTSQQESIQRSNVPLQQSGKPPQNSQSGASYPVSSGLSGNSGSGTGYPQGSGLSGSNSAPLSNQGINSPNNFRPHASPTNSFNNNNQPQNGPTPPPYSSLGNNYNNHHQGPPPPYTNYGGYGGHGGYGGSYGPQSPGYFGGYAYNGKNFGGVSQTRSALTGVGIAGAGIGTVLTGLALWNLARSTGRHHHTVIYDNRGQPIAVAPENSTTPVSDPFLANLVNCTLTINTDNGTEVLAIPCSIATSFTPDADVKDLGVDKNNKEDNTKCTITVVTKEGKEFMTTIPCSTLLKSAAENNVTETPININSTNIESFTTAPAEDIMSSESPTALRLSNISENTSSEHALPCTQEPGEIRDPINPCYSVKHNLTVIPLQPIKK
ncbi:uncharacterized protein DDB_G0283357-like [Vanessa tameamea]|uniref:Uncharacterized protein DDB_G0283357-like n=1 Tax=Vanessa tameamea TaxID=334116 RepID=A0A8B8IE07_VANTA